jgi:hypothetical protein
MREVCAGKFAASISAPTDRSADHIAQMTTQTGIETSQGFAATPAFGSDVKSMMVRAVMLSSRSSGVVAQHLKVHIVERRSRRGEVVHVAVSSKPDDRRVAKRGKFHLLFVQSALLS